MDQRTLIYSIRELSELLEKHYGEKVIILIDEYDVPLAKANERGRHRLQSKTVPGDFGRRINQNPPHTIIRMVCGGFCFE